MKIDRRNAMILAGVGALSLAASALLVKGQSGIVTPAKAQSASKLMEPQPLPDMVMGDAGAPVTIVEYASMTCPHCAAFHANTLPALKEKYIDTGKVKLILREFPFDPRAAAAFMLARCAPPEQILPDGQCAFPATEILGNRPRCARTAASNCQTGRFYTGSVRSLLEKPGTAGQDQGRL